MFVIAEEADTNATVGVRIHSTAGIAVYVSVSPCQQRG